MNREEYREYIKSVAIFREKEGITNLSQAYTKKCEECGHIQDTCEHCGKGLADEGYFSWFACDCCSRPLGRTLYHVNGYNPTTKKSIVMKSAKIVFIMQNMGSLII